MAVAEKPKISEDEEVLRLFETLKAHLLGMGTPELKGVLINLNRELGPDQAGSMTSSRGRTASTRKTAESRSRRELASRLAGSAPPPPAEVFRLEVENLKRGYDFRRRILEGALTAPQVGSLLGGKSRQMAHDRRLAGKLVAILEKGRWLFPLWQFDSSGPDGVVPGLPQVLHALVSLRPLSELEKAGFLITANPVLGGATPIQRLRQRHIDEVVSAARAAGAD